MIYILIALGVFLILWQVIEVMARKGVDRKQIYIIVLLLGNVALFGGLFYYSPYFGVKSLEKAINSKQHEKVDKRVDFGALKRNLKEQLSTKAKEATTEHMRENFLVKRVTSVAIDTAVDNILSNNGLIATIAGYDEAVHASFDNYEKEYEDMNTFVLTSIDGRNMKFVLTRESLVFWKLKYIRVPS